MEVYKLYATATADTTSAATLDVREDGHIVAMLGLLTVTNADALNDGAVCEVSFASSSGFASNDTHASILTMGAFQGFLTSGGGPVQDRVALSGLAIPVVAGERLHLHVDVTGTIGGADMRVYLYVMPTAGANSRAALRRA